MFLGDHICNLLDSEVGVKLSEEQAKCLVDRYTASNGYFNYKDFAQAINTRLNKKVKIEGSSSA